MFHEGGVNDLRHLVTKTVVLYALNIHMYKGLLLSAPAEGAEPITLVFPLVHVRLINVFAQYN